MLPKFEIKVEEKVFVKDPASSELGRKIITHSIEIIDKLGFEKFTFRKLAQGIKSTEPSIYRYFENKHKLLLYLLSWYWNWLDYQIIFHTHNIKDSSERLERALRILSEPAEFDPNFLYIDESRLNRIVINESAKAYLTKEVDQNNKEGLFKSYKRLCNRLADIVKEFNGDYPYPTALISTVIEASHSQQFFSEHLPSLTSFRGKCGDEVFQFMKHLVFSALSQNSKSS